MNNLTPEYLRVPTLPLLNHLAGNRSSNVLRPIFCRTDRHQNSFFPDSVKSWNNIGPELRDAKSLSVFKKNILKIIRPVKRSIFNIHNPMATRWIFQLRVDLSPLRSHKKAHNFQDTPNDKCLCNFPETTLHFLLKCTIHNEFRPILFQILNPILLLNDMTNLNDIEIVHLLLYEVGTFTKIELF